MYGRIERKGLPGDLLGYPVHVQVFAGIGEATVGRIIISLSGRKNS